MRPITSHAVHMVIPRFRENGIVEIAMMPYTKGYGTRKAFTTLRLPTETRKNGETVTDTALRGIFSEVAKSKGDFKVDVWGPAYAELTDDQDDRESSHLKVAVVMQHLSGDLRDTGGRDEDDADEYHGPMEWVEVRDILRGKTELKVIYSHKVAVCAFVRVLVMTPGFDEIGKEYYDLIETFPGLGFRSTEERDAVEAYITSTSTK